MRNFSSIFFHTVVGLSVFAVLYIFFFALISMSFGIFVQYIL